MKHSLFWVGLHSLLAISALVSLVTGWRIGTVSHQALQWLSPILPQGSMHFVHLCAAVTFSFIIVVFSFSYYLGAFTQQDRVKAKRYHRWVINFGFGFLPLLALSGWNRYFGWFPILEQANIHYVLAYLLLIYIVLHALCYYVQHGWAVIKLVTLPKSVSQTNRVSLLSVLVIASPPVLGVFCFSLFTLSHYRLTVTPVPLSEFIEIDGIADEEVWSQAVAITVPTFGGANFKDGHTDFSVRAVENGEEIYFHITWEDATQSLQHLPLKKTEKGWVIQQQGFHQFDEQKYYEDKMAVMLAKDCFWPIANSIHLGPKPLRDKPANWHGKGYHYTANNHLVDIWHWKAVRTNAMILADDNFFGPPMPNDKAQRRYTAGYLPDGKESGAYVMNWLWYKPGIITPKRLPKSANLLLPFQKVQQTQEHGIAAIDWVAPWFSYVPYDQKKDSFEVGTIMPSVLYRSNRFEGDRADVRAKAIWQEGTWSIEMARKVDTGSRHDVAIQDSVCMWLSGFDRAQIAHTRHIKPIKLIFQK